MRLNTKTHIYTHEGAKAKHINAEQQLKRTVLSCLLWENQFYENGQTIAERIESLADQVSPEFLSELAISARTEFKLRHAPLLLLVALAKRGGHIVRHTAREVINRPDELAEVIAMLWRAKKRNLPKQLSKGIADAFLKFDEYQFSKWDRDGDIKLRDAMFIVHPKPQNPEQEALFKKIANKELSPPNTWESRLVGGQDKKEVFTDLLTTNKLGYMALLRNLRGMAEVNVDTDLIKQAILKPSASVLPFRFIAAAKAAPMFERELDQAMVKLMEDQEKLMGKTIILVDVSGSMDDKLSGKSDLKRIDAACGLSILLSGICEHLRVFTFSDALVEVPPRQGMALSDAINRSQGHGGTLLGQALQIINRQEHDRLIVITDEQSHDKVPNPNGLGYMLNVASYKNGVGYGPWVHIDGFSEACVTFIREYEKTEVNQKAD